ncbi:MAG: PD-(D/E)XK nuclease family protein, partial [Patescibacteria group bacterium]
PPAAQAIFGQVIHKTLNDFYKSPKDKQSLKNLLKLLDKNWLDEGYSSKVIEKKYKSQAVKMLGDFFKKEYDSRSLPDSLEQSFVIKMAPGLRVGGRMDRVDREKDKIEIIDYKTGKAMDQKAADKSLQMSLYALAATDPGILKAKPEDVTLTFYFLENGQEVSTKRTSAELEKAKTEIIKKAEEIRKSDFSPTPSHMCDFCDFRLLCDAWK